MTTNEAIRVKHSIPLMIEKESLLDIYTSTTKNLTHGFHKYPAKFIPLIPKWAIDKYLTDGDRKLILDPFCGSGTTLVEGLVAGHDVVGIDIDPLSILISKVKTTPLNTYLLDKVSHWLLMQMRETQGVFIPEMDNLHHWFTEDAIAKLSSIRSLIDNVQQEFGNHKEVEEIKDFMIVCFSSIIRRVSNADNQSLKTYVSHTKIKKPSEVFTLFESQLLSYCRDIKEFSLSVNSNIMSELHVNNSTELFKENTLKDKFDLVITSPPYIKSIDYIYNQMAELFWVGDLFGLDTQTKQNIKKKIYTGTNQVFKSQYIQYSPFEQILDIEDLDDKLKEIYTTDDKNGHKHSYVTYRYFTEMESHFAEIGKHIKQDAHYIMVVGNSSVSDVVFNTSQYLIEIAERNGFKLHNYWGYNIKNRFMRFDRKGRGGKIDIDWVLDLVKV